MENYVSVSASLWDLLKKDRKWDCGPEHDEAFGKVINAPLQAIGYFKREQKTILTADTSPVGTGAVIRLINPNNEEERQVVLQNSRALTETEKCYSQIEKEAVAIIKACERLYLYLIGRKFTFETDNRALKFILNNSSSDLPARLSRSGLALQPSISKSSTDFASEICLITYQVIQAPTKTSSRRRLCELY